MVKLENGDKIGKFKPNREIWAKLGNVGKIGKCVVKLEDLNKIRNLSHLILFQHKKKPQILKDPNVMLSQQEEDDIAKAMKLSLQPQVCFTF